jgi:hypothetical protein
MSVLLTVPVLGAVCGMLCEPAAAMRAHRSHAGGVHHAAADAQAHGHHHADSASVNTAAHDRHAAASLQPAAEAPRPSTEWNGRCCDQPTLTLAAMPVVRHELQIDPAVSDSAFVVLSGSDVRPADLRRDTARTASRPRHTNPVLRV